MRFHLEGMLNKVLDEKKNWSIIKKLVFFSRNTSQEANIFFKKAARNHILFYGKELLSDEKEQKNILYSLHFNYDIKEFDDRIMRSFMRIITPKWHSYKEGKVAQRITIYLEDRRFDHIRFDMVCHQHDIKHYQSMAQVP